MKEYNFKFIQITINVPNDLLVDEYTAQHVFRNLHLLRQGILVNKCESFTNCYIQIVNAAFSCTEYFFFRVTLLEEIQRRKVSGPSRPWEVCKMRNNLVSKLQSKPISINYRSSVCSGATTTETYLDMLETVMVVDFSPDIWFQQDGKTN